MVTPLHAARIRDVERAVKNVFTMCICWTTLCDASSAAYCNCQVVPPVALQGCCCRSREIGSDNPGQRVDSRLEDRATTIMRTMWGRHHGYLMGIEQFDITLEP
jgi:hypothetical protein